MKFGSIVLQVSMHRVGFLIRHCTFKIAAMTPFNAKKCCHLVSTHLASTQRICSSVHQLPASISDCSSWSIVHWYLFSLQTFQSDVQSSYSPLCEILQSASVTITDQDETTSIDDALLTTATCNIPTLGNVLPLHHLYLSVLLYNCRLLLYNYRWSLSLFCCCCDDFLPVVLLHSIIGYWHHRVVRLSVCDAVHCNSQVGVQG